tara:strand:+ start:80 stop:319 length:240 start_codon:yes stop_codon:yes gene_type:complete
MFIFSVLVLVGILTIWFIADPKEFLAFFGVLLSGAIGLLLLAILGLGVLAALIYWIYKIFLEPFLEPLISWVKEFGISL